MLLTQAMCFFSRLNKIKTSYTLLFFQNSGKQKVSLIKNHVHVTERCQSSTLSPVKKNNRYPLTIGGLLLMLIPLTTFGLGTWQVKRKKWKEELINMLKARTSAPPLITLPEDFSELEDLEFRKFVVRGRYDHNNEVFIGPRSCLVDGGTPESGELISMSGKESYGYLVITPFVLSNTGQRILINRGWIKTKLKPQIKRPESLIQGEQTVVGVVRLKEKKSKFMPSNDPGKKLWFYRDIEEIATVTNSLPVFLDATKESSIPGIISAGQTQINLRNEHLSYIITWYSLSAATAFMWFKRYLLHR